MISRKTAGPLGVAVVSALMLTSSLTADVTLTATTKVEGLGQSGEGETVTVISGMKSRTESNLGRHESVTLLDIESRQMTVLTAKRKKAEVHDLAPLADQQASLKTQEVTLEPTGNSRQAAGYSCDDHNLNARIEAGMEGMEMTVVMSGVVCLSKDAPGGEEYGAFYQAMAEKGLFFGDPEAAKAQPGRERGMTELYRTMSEKGIALISDINIGFEGEGVMAAMMGRMKFETSTTITAISDQKAAADAFAVPANYKVKRR